MRLTRGIVLLSLCLGAVVAAAPEAARQPRPELYAGLGHAKPISAEMPFCGARTLAWSPDGRTLASGSQDCTVVLWDAATRKPRATFAGLPFGIHALAWSPGGKFLAARTGSSIIVWDTVSGARRAALITRGIESYDLAWSPDGRMVAALERNAAGVWEIGTGRRRASLRISARSEIYALAWSPDGKTIATGGSGKDDVIALWDIATGKLRASIAQGRGFITSLEWSPDGRTLASISEYSVAMLWDAATGRRLATLDPEVAGTAITPLVWSPNSKLIAASSETSGQPELVTLWDARTGKRRASLAGPDESGRWADLAWSPDGRSIAAADEAMTVLWDTQSRKRQAVLEGAGYPLAWSKDGRILATDALFSRDQTVLLWEGRTGRPRGGLVRHLTPIQTRCVSWSPDGRIVAVGARDRQDSTILLWDATIGRLRTRLVGLKGPLTGLAWSPEGKSVAAASGVWGGTGILGPSPSPDFWREGGEAMLWDAATGALRATLAGGTGYVAWSPDGRTLATSVLGYGASLWNPAMGERQTMLVTGSSVCALAWSPNGQILATNGVAEHRWATILWDVTTTRARISLRESAGPTVAIAWRPDGRTVATTADGRVVVLWNPANGEPRRSLILGLAKIWPASTWFANPVLAWNPDGKTLATVQNAHGLVKLWDAESGQLRLILSGDRYRIDALAWSPNGKILAGVCEDHTVILWDPAARKRRAVLRGHTGAITALAWSPEGRMLATGSEDGSLRLWDGVTGKERAAFYSLDEGKEWLVTTPEGYFAASAHGANLIQWRQGGRLWPGARFRRRFERPDLVRRALS